jgi:hypothetical protein
VGEAGIAEGFAGGEVVSEGESVQRSRSCILREVDDGGRVEMDREVALDM